jgi:hypothetical protein
MNYLKPWLWYLVCTLILCVLYCGLEKASGSLGFTAKCILCSWSIISIVITVMLFGLQTYIDILGRLPPINISGITIGASCLTLCISSSCVYSAV